ncbi:hypothetical protein DFH08DRAFT_805278 [Mycena albidolilacea]|uniref:Uncharacterized protein n=1 Tax=Mycena albidolilacea TaxID=1033008 RepID=A0AAD7A8C2_9AGAR|nr:hypothetical protein DFH08DRAFT_805278 [Mycena albidolilacea]
MMRREISRVATIPCNQSLDAVYTSRAIDAVFGKLAQHFLKRSRRYQKHPISYQHAVVLASFVATRRLPEGSRRACPYHLAPAAPRPGSGLQWDQADTRSQNDRKRRSRTPRKIPPSPPDQVAASSCASFISTIMASSTPPNPSFFPYAFAVPLYADVPSFFDDSNHDISTLRKLQQQMRSLPMTEIRAAIDEVLRPLNALNAKADVQAREVALSDLDYSRHTLLTGSIGYALPPEMGDVPGAAILAVCRVIFELPQRTSESAYPSEYRPTKPRFEKRKEKNPLMRLSGALSPSDLYVQGSLNELFRRCLSYKHLAVMLRKSKAEPVIQSAAKIFVVLDGINGDNDERYGRSHPWEGGLRLHDGLRWC